MYVKDTKKTLLADFWDALLTSTQVPIRPDDY